MPAFDSSVSALIEQKLARAIDDLYRVFKIYKQPTVLEASPYRDAEKILRDLSSAALRDLQPEQIGSYTGWALTTVGDKNDYRHFLPRIFELAIGGTDWQGTDPDSIARRLGYAGWRQWPAAEQEAIEAAFLATWEYKLCQHPDQMIICELFEWLESIAVAEVKLAETLDLWLRSPSPNAMLHCADLVIKEAEALWMRGTLSNRWKTIRPEIRMQIVAWLVASPVRDRLLETAAIGGLDASDSERALYAAGILESLALHGRGESAAAQSQRPVGQ